jgi:hypothetical protein
MMVKVVNVSALGIAGSGRQIARGEGEANMARGCFRFVANRYLNMHQNLPYGGFLK